MWVGLLYLKYFTPMCPKFLFTQRDLHTYTIPFVNVPFSTYLTALGSMHGFADSSSILSIFFLSLPSYLKIKASSFYPCENWKAPCICLLIAELAKSFHVFFFRRKSLYSCSWTVILFYQPNLLQEFDIQKISWNPHKHCLAFVSGKNQVIVHDFEDSGGICLPCYVVLTLWTALYPSA